MELSSGRNLPHETSSRDREAETREHLLRIPRSVATAGTFAAAVQSSALGEARVVCSGPPALARAFANTHNRASSGPLPAFVHCLSSNAHTAQTRRVHQTRQLYSGRPLSTTLQKFCVGFRGGAVNSAEAAWLNKAALATLRAPTRKKPLTQNSPVALYLDPPGFLATLSSQPRAVPRSVASPGQRGAPSFFSGFR